jgi:hypothetical protein
MTAEEHWHHANAVLDLERDAIIDGEPPGYMPRSLVCYSAYDLGYPYINTGNEDPEKAVALAKRLSMGDCDARELLLADLAFAPDGLEPNALRIEYGIEKTAAFLTVFGGNFFFPSSREDFAAAEPDPSEIPAGEERVTRIGNRVLEMVPDTEARLSETPICDILNDAIAFWTGDNQIGVDRDYAEILLRFSQQRLDDLPPDFYYVLGRFTGGFQILPDPQELGQDYISIAAAYGHPDAAIREGELMLATGDPREAQYFFLTAAISGHPDAENRLSKAIRKFGPLLDASDKIQSENLAKSYLRTRCELRPLP